ncbi:MAG: type I 3-dehydroquinate dehydratase [Planctomycetota bacterium]
MMTLACVPIMVESVEAALADAQHAKLAGADLVELRIDGFFHGSEGDDAADTLVIEELRGLVADCPLPVILTCRSAAEGGDYDGDESDRVSLLEKLCVNTDRPPAYLDFELAAYQRSANIRQKINLCVDHPKQQRDVSTRLILSMHDFEQRPSDLMRRLADAWAEPAASVVKFAYRCRSIRDNLEIFEILRDAPKPTIGLGMGEFGLMSRVLAPKFGGFLTFASLHDSAATAPGQPTIADLLGMYRLRSICKDTKVYGVIGWPVTQSMSPLIHNAGFEARGWDGVYLPMPVMAADDPADSKLSFETTFQYIWSHVPDVHGMSVTIPYKELAAELIEEIADGLSSPHLVGAANTLSQYFVDDPEWQCCLLMGANTDVVAIHRLLYQKFRRDLRKHAVVTGAGGVARAAVVAVLAGGGKVTVAARSQGKAEAMAKSLLQDATNYLDGIQPDCLSLCSLEDVADTAADVYINCTPVGMAGGPDPDGLSIPVHDLAGKLPPETVFFDTVYNPIETPMLKAAKEHGFRTIDGVELFVRQASAQFKLWTGEKAPVQLFDRLVRERLGGA